MTVKELIALLKKQPQDIQVAYSLHSEQCLLEANDISTVKLCAPRPDGWIHNCRPDKAEQEYLLFPGS